MGTKSETVPAKISLAQEVLKKLKTCNVNRNLFCMESDSKNNVQHMQSVWLWL